MHTNKTLALLAALTLGAASAETLAPAPTTTAGTTITNTASASFTNPVDGATSQTQSNTVSTTVLPRAGFNLTYRGGGDSANTNTPAGAPNKDYQRAVLPGTTVSFEYVAVNNGNTTQNIALSSQVTGDVSNVRFFAKSADTNNDGALSAAEIAAATAITSVTVAPNGDDTTTTSTVENNSGEVNFFMVYTVNAAPSTVVGATPVGTGQEYNGTTNVQKTETATDLFLQYSQITVQNSGALIGPRNDADGNGGPVTAPYTDAANNTVTPTASDSQQANVRASVTSVTFINTVQNSGDATDNFTVTSSTAGTVFLTPSGTQVTSSPTTVSVTPAKGGAAYDVTYALVNGNLVISGLQFGDSASFQNTVPFTDVTPNVSDTQTTTLTVASANNPQRTDTTTNVIRDPGLQFGDKKLNSNVPDAAYNPNPAAQPGATVTFPMQIVNTGGATDTFTVQPTNVIFPLVGGGTVTVPVTYVPTNCDGAPGAPSGTGSTLTLAAGAQGCFVASVTVPANALAATTTTITQTVTTGSGLSIKDDNNTITVSPTNLNTEIKDGIALAKFVQGTGGETTYAGITAPTGYTTRNEAAPGENLNYAIIAKNNFNAPVSNFFVCDTVPMNTTFISVSGGGLYSLDKGQTWSSAAPTTLAAGTPTAKGGEVCVAPAGRTLAAGSTFRADFTVRVN